MAELKNSYWGVKGGRLVSDFNAYRPSAPAQPYHKGEDVQASTGTEIVALADGVVYRSRNGGVSGYNQEITIRYDVRGVSRYVDYVWVLYGHLLRNSIPGIGKAIKRGQVIGKVGTSQDAMNTVPHAHVQMWVTEAAASQYDNSKAVDPDHIRKVLEPKIVPEHTVPEKVPESNKPPTTPENHPPKPPPAKPATGKRVKLADPTDGVKLSPNFTDGAPAGGWAGVTIHMMQDHFDIGTSWLRNPAASASTHFSVRVDGYIEQMVWENDKAWHARTAGMSYLGIEHDGTGKGAWLPSASHPQRRWVPKKFTTPADADELRSDDKMLDRSALLTAYLLNKYGLPIQHDFTRPPRRDTQSVVAGHNQMSGNDHVDPEDLFPWKAYMKRVKEYAYGERSPGGKPSKPTPAKAQFGDLLSFDYGVTEEQALAWCLKNGAHKDRAPQAVKAIYAEEPRETTWRPVVRVAQSFLETNGWKYGGDSVAWNMAGIKKGGLVGDEPVDFIIPATPTAGAHAQANHCRAYSGKDAVAPVHARYRDARAAQQGRGWWVTKISQLGKGIWATDPTYAGKIERIVKEMQSG